MPNAPDRARALCAALGLDGPAARETVAAAMREVERAALERAARWVEQRAGPGALVGEDVTRFVLGLARAIRALMEDTPHDR